VAAWQQEGVDGIEVWAQRFGLDAEPRTPAFLVSDGAPGPGRLDGPLLDSDPDGGFVIVWTEDRTGSGDTVVQVQGFSPSGAAAGPRIALQPITPGRPLRAVSVGIDAQGRYFLIVSEGGSEGVAGGPAAVWGQRFELDGTPLGSRREMPAGRLAVQRDGRFLLLWLDATLGWQLARFTAAGELAAPVRPLFLSFDARIQSFTADRFDNTALVARAGSDLLLLLANRDQVAQGAPGTAALVLATGVLPGLESIPVGAAALQATGSLYAAWTGPAERDFSGVFHSPILGRLFTVRRDADLCVYRASRLLCDTAGDGIGFELTSPFGRGAAAGDVPLMGDVDGDRRDDFCVVRNRRTLCDTAHDGGTAEIQTPVFGLPGDVPLLGDLDGDGRVEPCRFRAGVFLCDVARNGGAAELTLAFGLPDDRPVLGDVDGDGDDDPCVVRASRFLCDTAHNGGAAELRMNLAAAFGAATPTGTPLLGDVDGDGRDDPCVFAGNRLYCGVFGPAGGVPTAVIERPYGGTGSDLPVLGDVDAF
jgi:hypothetical protein